MMWDLNRFREALQLASLLAVPRAALAFGVLSALAIARPAQVSAFPGACSLRELSPLASAAANISDELAPGLLATVDVAGAECAALATVMEEHALALAQRAEVCESIRASGLTSELSSALAQAESRLTAARAALDDAQADLRAVVLAALTDHVGAENAAIAVRVASNLSRRVPDAWKALDLPQESPTWEVLESAWFKARLGMPDGAFTQAEPAYPVRAAC
jgi:hypothetical protein